MDVNSLENLIMDLISEELEILTHKVNEQKAIFNLHMHRSVTMFTKWKRNLVNEEDRQGYFKNFHKNKRRKRYLRKEMRQFIIKLEIPLYFNLKMIQYHDTLNGIIRSTFY